jgi:deoxyribonuclease V
MAQTSAADWHKWNVSLVEAQEIQLRLRRRVIEADGCEVVRYVAGADVSYDRGGTTLFAALVVLDVRTGEVVETASARREARFPYVPGYLSFREIPAALEAFGRLRQRPDLIICDGQGRAHPRRFGLASHLGVWLDIPTIGCAKSRLVGTHRDPGRRRGCHTQLRNRGEVIGEVVRTREGVRPVYVSVGHRISLPTARGWVLRLTHAQRLPRPSRLAHLEANRLRRARTAR